MKIEINKPTKDFYKELICILSLYPKIKTNPKLKIKDRFIEFNLYLYISIFFEIGSIIYFIITKSYLSVALMAIFITCIFLSIFIIKNMNKNLKNQLANSSTSTVLIDDKGIEFKNKKTNVKIMWQNISSIILNKETITILPNDDSVIICIPIKYYKELITETKKYIEEKKIIKNI